jgi:hypothetical protein
MTGNSFWRGVNPDFEMVAYPSPNSNSYFRYFGGQPFLMSSMLLTVGFDFDYIFRLRPGNAQSLKIRNNCSHCSEEFFVSSGPDSDTGNECA